MSMFVYYLDLEVRRCEFKNGGMGQSSVMAIARNKSPSEEVTLLSTSTV